MLNVFNYQILCYCQLIYLAMVLPLPLSANKIEIEGIMEEVIYGQSDNLVPKYTNSKDFKLSIDENKWMALIVDNDKRDETFVDYMEASYDGETFYLFRGKRKKNERAINSDGVGFMCLGLIPVWREEMVDYLWVAMASSEYFSTLSRPTEYLHPPWAFHLIDTDEEVQLRADFELMAGSLPKLIRYYGSQDNVEWLVGEYVVDDYQFFNQNYIPTKWKFTRYRRPSASGQGSEIEISQQKRLIESILMGQVENVVESTKNQSFIPLFEGPISVIDFRYRKADPALDEVFYLLEENKWPNMKSSVAYTAYIDFLEMEGIELAHESSFGRYIFYLLLSITIIFVLALMFLLRKNQ